MKAFMAAQGTINHYDYEKVINKASLNVDSAF